MRYYREMGLNLPDLSAFMSEPEFTAKKYFQLLPINVIVNVMRESLSLRIADIDAYRAFLLTMHCGLRRAEALAFKPAWLKEGDKDVIEVSVDGQFKPKHGKGRKVFIEPWVAALIRELGPVKEPASMGRLNAWATHLIPDEDKVNKPIHEMRKLWISCKAKTDGIHAASSQAGHTDVRTTTMHYADNSMSDRLIPLWKEPTAAAILKFKVA
jgi:integrase